MGSVGSNDEKAIREFMLHIATCHTIVIDKNTGAFNSASPDELALVEGVRERGYVFQGKDRNNCLTVKTPDGYMMKYELLNVLEFNSTRKRMSVIVKDMQTYEIVLLTKGADSIIEKLLVKGDKTNDRNLNITKTYLDSYANEGLRTLLLAKKTISQREYDRWNEEFNQASNTMVNRDEKMDEVSAKIEQDMILVGSTAIEDKLQEDVAETIIAMKETGIKVWVLTGDKVETAVNIGYSTGLLNNEMNQYYVDGTLVGEITH